jgi:2-hydroxymuconate-semialdehyde hydrolase
MDYLGIEQTSIVGHSYGGLVALGYTLHHPERVDKLIIADTGVPSVERRDGRDAVLVGWRESLQCGGVDIPEEKAEDFGYLIEQTVKLRGRSWRGMGARRAIARLTRFTTTTSFAKEYRETSSLTLDMIRQIQAPVLLIYGDRSPLTASFQALRDNLPNCRTAIVADGGHFYPLQHPETFVRHIKGFLAV